MDGWKKAWIKRQKLGYADGWIDGWMDRKKAKICK